MLQRKIWIISRRNCDGSKLRALRAATNNYPAALVHAPNYNRVAPSNTVTGNCMASTSATQPMLTR